MSTTAQTHMNVKWASLSMSLSSLSLRNSDIRSHAKLFVSISELGEHKINTDQYEIRPVAFSAYYKYKILSKSVKLCRRWNMRKIMGMPFHGENFVPKEIILQIKMERVFSSNI
jgi:hypothetical protein